MGLKRNFKATNLLTNSNFDNGLTGWIANNVTGSIVDGVLEQLATSQYGYYRQPINITTGKKYYLQGRVKTDSNLVKLYCLGGSGTGGELALTGDSLYHVVSIVNTATADATVNPGVRDYRTSGWTTVYIDYAMLLCLTDIFGVDNEPTAAWCDTNIPSWFDGTMSGGSMSRFLC